MKTTISRQNKTNFNFGI